MHVDWLNSVLAWGALLCAAGSVIVIAWYVWRRPPLIPTTRVLLFFGIAALPIGTAATANLVGFEATKDRQFCGSCHVMQPWIQASQGPENETLAWIHTRNKWFGGQSCYTCHSDYEMFGTVATKLAGMRHLFEYYTHYRDVSAEDATAKIELYKPFSGRACAECHSTELPGWKQVPDHAVMLTELRQREIGCVGKGCHGPAHPFSKPAGTPGGTP